MSYESGLKNLSQLGGKIMKLSNVVENLKSFNVDGVVLCEAYRKRYLLCHIGFTKDELKSKYGFKPIDRTAFYDFGLGTTNKCDNLYDYLESCIKCGYALFFASSLVCALSNNSRKIELDNHIIKINNIHYGKHYTNVYK